MAVFVCLLPAFPILIVIKGFVAPEYIFKGTLNLNGSELQHFSFTQVYFKYIDQLLQFNFGESVVSGNSVSSEVLSGFFTSSSFILVALLLAIVGMLINSSIKADPLFNSFKQSGQSYAAFIPLIVLSYFVQYVLFKLGISLSYSLKMISASLVITVIPTYVGSNQLRKTMKQVINSDFFNFHLACGFNHSYIWNKLTARLAWMEILNISEYLMIYFFAFSVFVEIPFNIQGMGFKFINAIQHLDYPIIIGFCIFQIIFLSIVGLIIEVIKMKLDPRLSKL